MSDPENPEIPDIHEHYRDLVKDYRVWEEELNDLIREIRRSYTSIETFLIEQSELGVIRNLLTAATRAADRQTKEETRKARRR